MSRPLIGVTAYLEAARWGAWVREAVVSPPSYAKAVTRAGGAPVIIPPLRPDVVDDYVRGLSGLVLAGGVEIDPTLYGEQPDDRVEDPQPHRDRFELALARAAVEADVPILAIARGMHVLNIAQGGSLIGWLPEAVGHERHHETQTPHTIQVSVSSKLGKALGDSVEVAAPHRQAVRRLGSGLIAVAWADDQIVEGVELQGHRFGVGVQWHPERGDDNRLFDALVDAARP
ncbi:gamma-glutamyl-gamma-aminobutyrate hydrolase family protein [Spongiactinospora sp. TRM90649]|uniref:gamma-glutamyl-gamma-aminobutyrate hydrolase family protein n=1 Tax=Spongiactinospora sp. TRM90649 TaxID=3031114 RepID=UPI0023F78BB9|nr:gamma-glutamyl-gamma-aminobutyrate hydrolase family protein [Spongiactinospora sp. TRM90649]MDF5757145.1 gamma-glutamyl-gamma-aminobutyrate hydrolase family protein [Spongiactinospora sp. TRM90649]